MKKNCCMKPNALYSIVTVLSLSFFLSVSDHGMSFAVCCQCVNR